MRFNVCVFSIAEMLCFSITNEIFFFFSCSGLFARHTAILLMCPTPNHKDFVIIRYCATVAILIAREKKKRRTQQHKLMSSVHIKRFCCVHFVPSLKMCTSPNPNEKKKGSKTSHTQIHARPRYAATTTTKAHGTLRRKKKMRKFWTM